jgi:hypothetical protein
VSVVGRQGKLKAFRIAGLRKVLIPRAERRALLKPARGDQPGGANRADETPAMASTTGQPGDGEPLPEEAIAAVVRIHDPLTRNTISHV